jgi:hypothetical protein
LQGVFSAAQPALLMSRRFVRHQDLFPTRPAPRHGVLRSQVDVSARVTWILETRLGLDVRWTKPTRLARISTATRRNDAPAEEQIQELTP